MHYFIDLIDFIIKIKNDHNLISHDIIYDYVIYICILYV